MVSNANSLLYRHRCLVPIHENRRNFEMCWDSGHSYLMLFENKYPNTYPWELVFFCSGKVGSVCKVLLLQKVRELSTLDWPLYCTEASRYTSLIR